MIKKILIVDDDDSIYQTLAYLFKMRFPDYAVLRASNGKEALQLVESEKAIKLILLDYQMPVMNGVEALQEIRKNKIPVKVLMMSGYDGIEILAVEHGADDVMGKPFPSNLCNIVEKLLPVNGGE